jgi:cytochrome b6-f complex iron-sulfur subunit
MSKEDNLQKNWKQDFPIKKEQSQLISRRDFAKFLVFISGGLMVGSGVIAAEALLFPDQKSDKEHFVCKKSEIPVGGTRSFVINGDGTPYLMIHLEDGSFHAYEQKCTHLSCAVFYAKGTGKIECPCHRGFFDAATGEVLAGPPPRALPKLVVVSKGDDLLVKQYKV